MECVVCYYIVACVRHQVSQYSNLQHSVVAVNQRITDFKFAILHQLLHIQAVASNQSTQENVRNLTQFYHHFPTLISNIWLSAI
jgi:hypothetical protein